LGILRTIIIRVLYAAALLFAVLVLNFSLMHLAPGDVADTISQSMGGADQEILDEIRVSYGLDQPFIVQLGKYIANVAQFDLGYSFFYNQPVSRLILERLPATLLLVITAQIAALIIGVVLGVISARKPKGISNYVVTFLALFGYSAPVFWTGILLLITFSLNVHWFPVAGMRDVTVEGGFWTHFVDVARHLVLPSRHTWLHLSRALFAPIARLDDGSLGLRLHSHRQGQRPKRSSGGL
jgi:peptide/nickel transport system permease protein